MSVQDLIDIQQFSIYVANKCCFKDFTASVRERERVLLIGDNGSGKSSLLRALQTHSSSIIHSHHLKVAYLPQKLCLDDKLSVWDLATQNIKKLLKLLDEFEECSSKLGDSPQAAKDYDKLLKELLSQDAFFVQHRVEELLESSGLSAYKDSALSSLSGGMLARVQLISLLVTEPNLLLLDEPSNHLDQENREWLYAFLRQSSSAYIIVSHDMDLLELPFDSVWHIVKQHIRVFQGRYRAYQDQLALDKRNRNEKIKSLKAEKEQLVKAFQKEQTRMLRTQKQGQKKHGSSEKMLKTKQIERAENTQGASHKKRVLLKKHESIQELKQMHETRLPELSFHYENKSKFFSVSIASAQVSYKDKLILKDINLSICTKEKLALLGPNGSGKSSFIKALMGDSSLNKKGFWQGLEELIKNSAYLDQHYSLLNHQDSIELNLEGVRPEWGQKQRRDFLRSFLFFDQRRLTQKVESLSEGEKVRLCLAIIAAKAPAFLILDEVCNNLDLNTKQYLAGALSQFEGGILISEHEQGFLELLGIKEVLQINEQSITRGSR
ncbi:MAG: ATP-binding cassette domain-containing protein [Chlamydiales bacterium]|nr:ATP-binding cassette domain-containing protein [Chlamydiales bacterium]